MSITDDVSQRDISPLNAVAPLNMFDINVQLEVSHDDKSELNDCAR